MQPGDMIQPGGSSAPEDKPKPEETPVAPWTPPSADPTPPENPVAAVELPDAQPQAVEPQLSESASDASWYNADLSDNVPQSPPPASVSWTASEYVLHEKSAGWYGLLVVGAVVAAGLVYLLTKDLTTVGVICFVAIVLAYYAVRRPRTLNYQIQDNGIAVGSKFYHFVDFKSFAVIDEGAIASLTLLPLKRFMPPLSIYYPPDQEESILAAINNYLPFEHAQADPIDRLMSRLRF